MTQQTTAEKADAPEPPREMTYPEFRQRLRNAGWTEAEIDAHLREIEEDDESGEQI